MPRINGYASMLRKDLKTTKNLLRSVTGVEDDRFYNHRFKAEEKVVLTEALIELKYKLEREISRGY